MLCSLHFRQRHRPRGDRHVQALQLGAGDGSRIQVVKDLLRGRRRLGRHDSGKRRIVGRLLCRDGHLPGSLRSGFRSSLLLRSGPPSGFRGSLSSRRPLSLGLRSRLPGSLRSLRSRFCRPRGRSLGFGPGLRLGSRPSVGRCLLFGRLRGCSVCRSLRSSGIGPSLGLGSRLGIGRSLSLGIGKFGVRVATFAAVDDGGEGDNRACRQQSASQLRLLHSSGLSSLRFPGALPCAMAGEPRNS